MNTVYSSIYLYLFQFLSSVPYNFLSTSHLHLWLHLFQDSFFFDAVMNGIVFLVSLSDSSLLVYKDATDFWIFILYTIASLNSCISYSNFLEASLEFFIYSIMSSAIMTVLLFPFQFECLLLFLV